MIRCDDARLCAITYAVCAYGPNDKRGGITVHAVFVDDKFSKFIRWSTDWKDCPVEARLNEKVGDCLRLKRALETPAVSIDDLRSEAVAQKAPPDDVDWGLTAVFLILSPILPSAKRPTTADIKRNAELREQFKAARLDFGMTESEVQETLKAKPIEAGATEAGAYAIYGSNESFSLYWGHLFSNVLVVFREGRLIAAYDICAGAGWREALRRTFGDLEKR
jgi:hypothetical protein